MASKFGVLPDNTSNIPLILDHNDPHIKFTEPETPKGIRDQHSSTSRILDWRTLNFEDEQYYTAIEDKNSGRSTLGLQHSHTARNLYLIEPRPKNVETLHHPNMDVAKIIGQQLCDTFKFDKTRVIDSKEHVSSFLKNI